MLPDMLHTVLAAGKEIHGKVTVTISRGRLVWHQGKLNVEPGTGRFIKLPVDGPLFGGLQHEGADTADRLIKSFSADNGHTPVHRAASHSAASEAIADRQEL